MQYFLASRGGALALSALLATPLAFAQDGKVTVFGVMDIGLNHATADGAASLDRVESDGNTSSRLGVRGVEELGAGWRANFWLEAAVNVDTGAGGATSTNNKDSINTGGLTWGRRATVGVSGPVGELRLGRDYVPSFYNLNATMHPFGTNGVGSSGHLFYPVNTGGTTVRTNVRASNSIGYLLPDNAFGVYGNLMHARGEQVEGTPTSQDGNLTGARLGWRGAGVNMAVARSKTRYATGDYAQTNAAINYQLGPAKLMYLWGRNDVGVTRTTAQMIGTQYQVTETGELRLHFSKLKAERVANDATHWAVGWVHDLSKRTQLYATYGMIDNKDEGTRFDNGVRPTTPGGTSRGADLGVKHSF